jgi:hypothetical protein
MVCRFLLSERPVDQSCKVAVSRSYYFKNSGKAFCSCENLGNVFVQLKIFHSFFTNCRSNTSHLSELSLHQQECLIISQACVAGTASPHAACMKRKVQVQEGETLTPWQAVAQSTYLWRIIKGYITLVLINIPKMLKYNCFLFKRTRGKEAEIILANGVKYTGRHLGIKKILCAEF